MECFCSTSEKQDGDGLKERSKRSENEIFEQSTCVWLSPSHRFSPWHQLPSLMKVALLPLSCCRKLSMYSVMTFRGHRWSCCQSARRLVLSRGRLGCGQDEMNRCERREGPAWLCNLGHTLCVIMWVCICIYVHLKANTQSVQIDMYVFQSSRVNLTLCWV